MTCLIPSHIVCPDLIGCHSCRHEYEEYLLRKFGEKAVEKFRTEMQKENVVWTWLRKAK